MISAGKTLRTLREQKPLVHQITNYVVMNETANATLALGALPVMAHAGEEVEEMARLASSLVLNIGTLSGHWVESMLLAAGTATAREIPIVLDPVGAGATQYRTATSLKLLELFDVTILRGNAGEIATLAGERAEVRGVESMGSALEAAELARTAARRLSTIASVTGPVDYVSDGDRVLAVSNGHELLATVTGTGCMSSALTGCFVAAKPDEPLEAAAEALAAFGVAAEDAAAGAGGPGTFHARLYDALYALDPGALDERTRIEEV
jgi:hydroxyethylthiazole kinase